MTNTQKKEIIPTLLKYLFSLCVIGLSIVTTGEVKYIIAGIWELLLIASVTELLIPKCRIAAIVINDILMLIFNVQMLMLYFGNSFILLIMLTNLESAEDLAGNAPIYAAGIIAILVFSLLPVKSLLNNYKYRAIFFTISAGFWSFFAIPTSFSCSPICALVNVGFQYVSSIKQDAYLKSASDEEYLQHFYKQDLTDAIKKDNRLPENPNIVLIFTEGLSQRVIDDERNIMPNLRALQQESFRFDNYFNHTAATYRAISGSLYSGYQLKNYDSNCLISLQDILSDNGYETTFINTEPENKDFTRYLNEMGFDSVVGPEAQPVEGNIPIVTDKRAYEYLYDTIKSKESQDKPYFVCLYTFGTHASWNSTDDMYEDGRYPFLNRFYNVDLHLGTFFDKVRSEGLDRNTIFVFTADHAAYHDKDYTDAFPRDTEEYGVMLGRIPLFIYYSGVKNGSNDVNGRNSLDLAPTILDYLDISAPNYFLGTSLFAERNDIIDTTFHSEGPLLSTDGCHISTLSGEDLDYAQNQINHYFLIKKGTDANADSLDIGSLNIKFEDNNHIAYLSYKSSEPGKVWFPIWSEENGQNDIKWYKGKAQSDGTFTAKVKLSNHLSKQGFEDGEYLHIQVYTGAKDPTDTKENGLIWINKDSVLIN